MSVDLKENGKRAISVSEIKERLNAVYGNSSPSTAIVKIWFNEFQRGRTSVFNELQSHFARPPIGDARDN